MPTREEAHGIAALARDALAEFDALPAETARRVAVAFTRYAAMATSGQINAAGLDPRDAPAFFRFWRALPGRARFSLMAAALAAAPVASGALQQAGADLYEAVKNGIRSIAAREAAAESDPTPARPLPRLVTPEDAASVGDQEAAVCRDSDPQRGAR